MRLVRPLHLALAVVVGGAVLASGCGNDDDADPAAFCERLERLTENDPFAAFGDTASEAEMEAAFAALTERAEELVEVAPDDAEAAATDYRDAAVALDELLAGAGYGIDVDVREYREQQLAYTEAAQRLERYLTTGC